MLDAKSLPFAAGNFDTVVSTFTMCSIPDIDSAMAEIARVLKPGGRFLFVERGLSEDAGVKKWQHRLTPISKKVGDGCHLDRDIKKIVETRLEIASLDRFYMEKTPKFAGYIYLGAAGKE